MPTTEVLKGYESLDQIHEHRPILLARVKSRLVPEGLLAIAAIEKCPRSPDLEAEYNPELRVALLNELAEQIASEIQSFQELLSKLGHLVPPMGKI